MPRRVPGARRARRSRRTSYNRYRVNFKLKTKFKGTDRHASHQGDSAKVYDAKEQEIKEARVDNSPITTGAKGVRRIVTPRGSKQNTSRDLTSMTNSQGVKVSLSTLENKVDPDNAQKNLTAIEFWKQIKLQQPTHKQKSNLRGISKKEGNQNKVKLEPDIFKKKVTRNQTKRAGTAIPWGIGRQNQWTLRGVFK